MELVNKRRCVIVGAAKIENSELLKKNIFYDDFVIGADAGYKALTNLGITPDLIVGDFDSCDTPEFDVEVIALNPIKDCTDMEFAVKKAFPIFLFSVLRAAGLTIHLQILHFWAISSKKESI